MTDDFDFDCCDTRVLNWDEFREALMRLPTAAERVSYAAGKGFDFTAAELAVWVAGTERRGAAPASTEPP